jgi:hypothetical protein
MSDAGRMLGGGRRSGALVPAGWALINAVWLWVQTGFDAGGRPAVGNSLPLYIYSGSIGITMLLAGFIVLSGWRHTAEARQHALSRRGDIAIYAALGVFFSGMAVVFGAWWVPIGGPLLVLALWLLLREARFRARHPG